LTKRSMLVVLAAVSLAAVLTTVAIFVFGGGPSTKTVVIKKGFIHTSAKLVGEFTSVYR
jgi:hypothetical protein